MADHATTVDLRCSAVLFREQAVLLVHRGYDSGSDWVLPGGTPLPGESMIACARREVREETGLSVDPVGVAFVLEAAEPGGTMRTVDLVFLVTEAPPVEPPRRLEPALDPRFTALDRLHELDLRPPLAGYLRGLHDRGADPSGIYLGNLWRPTRRPAGAGARSGA
ncbi:NUDIX hydrolase [Jiangella anatolica]|uniref:NUDIX domain-containing protein n=1 Tax=Jiangella anatolica TaxID=2670374 RepID=A0A2W2CL12_9ACTN|nr:NUDIX hydrolase [Jiangella anatolica]PZF86086.1 NUDIX domain-containing protein [Jiangella anatolica]